MIVVDASVLATALGDDGPDGDRARARLRGERLSAPELVDLEVASVLRRQAHGGEVDIRRAALALADPARLAASAGTAQAPAGPLLGASRHLTVYYASYVALAEALDVTLLTGDGRLARATGPRCPIEMLRPASLSASAEADRVIEIQFGGCRRLGGPLRRLRSSYCVYLSSKNEGVNARDHMRALDSDIDSPRWLRAAVRMSSMTVLRGITVESITKWYSDASAGSTRYRRRT